MRIWSPDRTRACSAIYVVDITRLFRDQYLINATQFVKLCSEKGVFVVTESMVFDLRQDVYREMFMMQAQYASRELKMILNRLGGSRKAKAEMGKYAGDAVPVGFIVVPDGKGSRLNEFAIYEPHATIIRLIFAKMLELRRLQAVARWCNQQGLFFPNFEPEYSYMTTRSAMRGMRPMPGPGGESSGRVFCAQPSAISSAIRPIRVNSCAKGKSSKTISR